MQITKNIWKGGEITDLNEIVRLAKEKKSLLIFHPGSKFYQLKPAAFIQNWMLVHILRVKLYYAIHERDISVIEI